jgi:hypothetical protein
VEPPLHDKGMADLSSFALTKARAIGLLEMQEHYEGIEAEFVNYVASLATGETE